MEEGKIQHKYVCDKCNFKCNIKSGLTTHNKTELHITGQRKKRTDCKEPIKCEKCDYKTKNKTALLKHVLNNHKTKEERKNEFRFYCANCDFGTYSKDTLNIHNNTKKHIHFVSLGN